MKYTLHYPDGIAGATCDSCGSYRPTIVISMPSVALWVCHSCLVQLRAVVKEAFKASESARPKPERRGEG